MGYWTPCIYFNRSDIICAQLQTELSDLIVFGMATDIVHIGVFRQDTTEYLSEMQSNQERLLDMNSAFRSLCISLRVYQDGKQLVCVQKRFLCCCGINAAKARYRKGWFPLTHNLRLSNRNENHSFACLCVSRETEMQDG
jgi:hypothetical protein